MANLVCLIFSFGHYHEQTVPIKLNTKQSYITRVWILIDKNKMNILNVNLEKIKILSKKIYILCQKFIKTDSLQYFLFIIIIVTLLLLLIY